MLARIATRSKTCTIALVGKYVKLHDAYPVSYTHLDVYKRQVLPPVRASSRMRTVGRTLM